MKHFNYHLSLSLLVSMCLPLIAEPPRVIPPELKDAFTMGGSIPVLDFYIDGSYESSKPIHYDQRTIDDYVRRVRKGNHFHYNETDGYLYDALKQFSIEGSSVAIMGSVEPVYEAIAIAYGASPTTIEYNTLTTSHPKVRCLTVEEFQKNPEVFDCAFSISSFEHDGLGRYGDPINPSGDLEAMAAMKKTIKPGGFLFLAIPVGRDCLCWNAHRIYGAQRLPKLFEGWELVASYGFNKSMFDLPLHKYANQPVFVLKNL